MATEKKINSRIQQKHDVAANWAKATNFIPKKGEIIIYDAEYNASGEETQAVRFKIGDGSKTVNNLPFAVIDYSSDIETLEQKVANNSTAIGKIQGAFETNGTTVKKATSAGTADKVANGLTLGGGVVYDGSKALSITAGNKMSITGGPGGVSIGLAHSVMPSTYNKVTVDGYGTVTAGENVDYLTSQSIKKLNTNNTAAQDPNASEAIVGTGTINLHKIAKTGSYDDLSHKPTFVSSVNGSSGAITNVAKTDETNVFTNSQIILKPSDETQASLWNYSGCIGYSHWVQGSPSEPRIGIGYKNSGIRVFNGTTETPAQYYDVTMPSQAGQLVTDTFAKFTGETSGIGHPYRVFPDEEAYATYQSGDPFSVKYTSQTNAALIINTDANNRTAFVDGRIDNKKNGTKYELTLPTKTGTLALTSDIPTVNNGTLTIQKNGTKVQTFTANQSSSVTANITVPTKTSELTNDSGFLTSHQDISGKANLAGGNTFTGKQTLNSPASDGYSINAAGYVKGSWLQSSAISNKGTNTGKVCVFDDSGWIYYRTPTEILTEANGVPKSAFSLSGTTLTITM